MPISETEDWEIEPAWRQMGAAYWSISWPAWILSFIPTMIWLSGPLTTNAWVASLVGYVTFMAVQATLTRRLVRKNYRSFRVHVVRDDGESSRKLSIRESHLVWLRILSPQVAWSGIAVIT